MMFDQFSAIFDNTPAIDALQNRHGVKRGKYESLRDVFGESFSWKWFLPLEMTAKMRMDFEAEVQRELDVGANEISPSTAAHSYSNHHHPPSDGNGHHVTEPLLSDPKAQ